MKITKYDENSTKVILEDGDDEEYLFSLVCTRCEHEYRNHVNSPEHGSIHYASNCLYCNCKRFE